MRLKRSLPYLLLVALGLVLAVAAARSAAGSTKSASITGKVLYEGKAPKREPLDTSAEPACADEEILDEKVVTGKNGGLKDVLVRVELDDPGERTPPTWPVIIRQKDCMYRPRVAGVVAGQPVWIENNDGFMHNVHARQGGETWFNRSQPKGAPAIKQKELGEPGEVLELRCDVHPWMRAYVAVSAHPLFATSGDDGTFEIKHVPKGKRLTIKAWHPKLGKKTVKARAGDEIEISFP